MKELLIATKNPGKASELAAMLTGLPLIVVSLLDIEPVDDVIESADTFDGNARLKAAGYAAATGRFALADDSGLEVDALGGRPGVLSARFGGAGLSFEERVLLLLDELARTGTRDRSARFVAAIAVADPSGRIIAASTGLCPGRIANKPSGAGGFGYDPIFVPDGYEETFGELSANEKSRISHRRRAYEQILPYLRDNLAIFT